MADPFSRQNPSEITFKPPKVWNELRLQEKFTDCIIKIADGTSIRSHRLILAGASPYFHSLLYYSDGSGDQKDPEEIVLDIEKSTLDVFMEFFYTGKCHIEWYNIEDLLRTADKFVLEELKEFCCRFLEEEMKAHNAVGIYLYARHFSCAKLAEKSRRFLLQNFEKVILEQDELNRLNVVDLFEILNDDQLNVEKEERVIEVVRSWIEFDRTNRANDAPKLLETVRFGLFRDSYEHNLNYLAWIKEICPYDTIETMKTNEFALYEDRRMYRSRIPNDFIFVIGGWSKGCTTDSMEVFDEKAQEWLEVTHLPPQRRAYHGVVELDGKIYLVGGFDGHSHFNSVMCFDPDLKRWEEKGFMQIRRCYVSTLTQGGKIWAIGGFNGHFRLNSMECYDPQTNQWTLKAPMKFNRSDADAACIGNRIIVAGGYDGFQVLNSCEVYDTDTDLWNYFEFMLSPRSGLKLLARGSFLFAIAGYDGNERLKTVESIDLDLPIDRWTIHSELNTPRSNFAAVIFKNSICVIGGFTGSSITNRMEFFDFDESIWKPSTPLLMARSALGACVVSNLQAAKSYSRSSKLWVCRQKNAASTE